MKVIIKVVCLFSMALSSAYASQVKPSQSTEVMTIQEFAQALKESPLFNQQTTQSAPLTNEEQHSIEMAEQYKDSSFGGKFDTDRNIAAFKGDTLVIGGGKRSGDDGHNTGITNIEKELTEIERLEKHSKTILHPDSRFSPVTGKKLDSAGAREEEVTDLQKKIHAIKDDINKRVLDKYFSLNIERSVQPDFLASITNTRDMSKIPDHRFKKIIFENVDCMVFLNSNTYKILSRITAPGGMIHITTGTFCDRLLPIVAGKTKWKASIYAQLAKKTAPGIDIKIRN